MDKDLKEYFESAEPLTAAERAELDKAGRELDNDPEFVEEFRRGMEKEARMEKEEHLKSIIGDLVEACDNLLFQMKRHPPKTDDGQEWEWGDTVPHAEGVVKEAKKVI